MVKEQQEQVEGILMVGLLIHCRMEMLQAGQ